jgi:signal transduction histidine kinase
MREYFLAMQKQIQAFLFFLFLFAISVNSFSENQSKIDSLKTVILTESKQENIAYSYNSIAELFAYTNLDSAFFYARKGLSFSKQINYKEGIGEAYFLLGYYHDQAGDYTSAIEDLERASKIFIEIGDSSYLCGCYNNIGVLYSYGIDQAKGLEYFIKTMNLALKLGETYSLSDSYSNIASYYEVLKDYSSALKYYLKGLEIDLEQNNVENIAYAYLDIGIVNLKLQRFDNALDYLKLAQQVMPKIKDQYREIELLIGFVEYYLETDDLESASSYIKLAELKTKLLNYPVLDANIISVKGDWYYKEKKYAESLKAYNEAIKKYTQLNSREVFYELYLSKSRVLSQLGKHNLAFEWLEMANLVQDSIKQNDVAKLLGEFEQVEVSKEERIHYQLEQKLKNQESEIELYQTHSNLEIAIFSIVLLFLIILVGLFYFTFKQKNNKVLALNYATISKQKSVIEENFEKLEINERKLRELNATKDKFFSIIAHDLKSPFSVLIGLSDIMLQSPDIKNSEEFDEILVGMFQTATSGYNLLENLLEWARTQTGNIQHKPDSFLISEAIQKNISFLQETANSKGISFNILNGSNHNLFADFDMTNCILRNLLNNAIKFSYPNNEIEIFTQIKGEFCIIDIKDFGVGMNKETIGKLFKIESGLQSIGTAEEKGTGLGLILCKEFVEINGGEIWVKSNKGQGSTFSFSLPLSK